jgi:hypothetical protein
MKKGKILIVGLIALLMAGGLVLAGCEEKTCDCHYDYNSNNPVWCGDSICAQGDAPGGGCKCEK